jgi:hypothetical protein
LTTPLTDFCVSVPPDAVDWHSYVCERRLVEEGYATGSARAGDGAEADCDCLYARRHCVQTVAAESH